MLLLFSLFCSVYALPNCRAPNDFIPDPTAVCNIAASCDWCERNQLSYDFLCCETGKWIGPHLTNPLLFYLMWNNVPWTVILIVAFEIFEVVVFTLIGSFDLLFADDNDWETIAASVIGDVLTQGGLGLLIGYVLRVVLLVPTLVSSWERAEAYDAKWRRAVYIVILYGILLVSYILPGWTLASGVRIGLIIQTIISLAFIWIIMPLGLRREIDKRMIWTQLDGTLYSSRRKFMFFFLWGLIVIVSHAPHLSHVQPSFAVNEWYQQWVVMGPITFVLVIMALVVSVSRGDGFTVWILAGALALVLWFLLWSIYALFAPTADALVWIGAALLPIAGAFFAYGAVAAWSGTRIPGSPASVTKPAATTTRLASRHIVKYDDEEKETAPLLKKKKDSNPKSTNGLRRRTTVFDAVDWDFS